MFIGLTVAGIVVFDFKKTRINCDSDAWVLDWFGLSEMSALLFPALPRNALMAIAPSCPRARDPMTGEIHSSGRTVKEVKDCLKAVPIHPRVASAIRAPRAYGCELKIVTFFIRTVLEQHGLHNCFSVHKSIHASRV